MLRPLIRGNEGEVDESPLRKQKPRIAPYATQRHQFEVVVITISPVLEDNMRFSNPELFGSAKGACKSHAEDARGASMNSKA